MVCPGECDSIENSSSTFFSFPESWVDAEVGYGAAVIKPNKRALTSVFSKADCATRVCIWETSSQISIQIMWGRSIMRNWERGHPTCVLLIPNYHALGRRPARPRRADNIPNALLLFCMRLPLGGCGTGCAFQCSQATKRSKSCLSLRF